MQLQRSWRNLLLAGSLGLSVLGSYLLGTYLESKYRFFEKEFGSQGSQAAYVMPTEMPEILPTSHESVAFPTAPLIIAPTQDLTGNGCIQVYVVVSGDTAYGIGRKVGVSEDKLDEFKVQLDGINGKNTRYINVGEVLKVPIPGCEGPSGTDTQAAVQTQPPVVVTQDQVGITPTPPQVAPPNLVDFMGDMNAYLIERHITKPQIGQQITDWAEDVMHLNDLRSYYPCMSPAESASIWNWQDARNCIATIDGHLAELGNRLKDAGIDHYLIDDAETRLDELSQLAVYEEGGSLYTWKVKEVTQVLGAIYSNIVQELPENLFYTIPKPTIPYYGIVLDDGWSIFDRYYDYYMLADNTRMASDESVYDDSFGLFGKFFVDEHEYAKRIFVAEAITGDINYFGIFEYESSTDADAALSRLLAVVNIAPGVTIEGKEYPEIFWKVPPDYNYNYYALIKKADRFLIIADPNRQIKSDDNAIVEEHIAPLLK